MEKVSIDDIEPLSPDARDVPDGARADAVGGARILTDPLGTTDLSINHYELEPGESFSVSTHRHGTQEELFYVISGTATFEIGDGEARSVSDNRSRSDDGVVTVGAGEVVRIPPGTFQFGTNDGNEPVTALALGAPRDYEDETEWLVRCEDCDERTVHVFEETAETGEYVYRCRNCEGETFRVST